MKYFVFLKCFFLVLVANSQILVRSETVSKERFLAYLLLHPQYLSFSQFYLEKIKDQQSQTLNQLARLTKEQKDDVNTWLSLHKLLWETPLTEDLLPIYLQVLEKILDLNKDPKLENKFITELAQIYFLQPSLKSAIKVKYMEKIAKQNWTFAKIAQIKNLHAFDWVLINGVKIPVDQISKTKLIDSKYQWHFISNSVSAYFVIENTNQLTKKLSYNAPLVSGTCKKNQLNFDSNLTQLHYVALFEKNCSVKYFDTLKIVNSKDTNLNFNTTKINTMQKTNWLKPIALFIGSMLVLNYAIENSVHE